MTVDELITILSKFPENSEVTLWCNFMQDAGVTVHLPNGTDVDIWET